MLQRTIVAATLTAGLALSACVTVGAQEKEGQLAAAGFVCFSHAARAATLTETFTLPTPQSQIRPTHHRSFLNSIRRWER